MGLAIHTMVIPTMFVFVRFIALYTESLTQTTSISGSGQNVACSLKPNQTLKPNQIEQTTQSIIGPESFHDCKKKIRDS